MHGARELDTSGMHIRSLKSSLAFPEPLPGFEELGEPGHGLLLDGQVVGEHVPVLD